VHVLNLIRNVNADSEFSAVVVVLVAVFLVVGCVITKQMQLTNVNLPSFPQFSFDFPCVVAVVVADLICTFVCGLQIYSNLIVLPRFHNFNIANKQKKFYIYI